jgi:predicted aconitase with swiveling domain
MGAFGMTLQAFQGQLLNPGEAAGTALVLSEPLSFWGGFDPASGRVIDRHHPQAGAELAGTILVLPESRGSAGTPAGVAEAVRRGTAPCAIVLGKADANVAAGALVAAALYGRELPVVALVPEELDLIRDGGCVSVRTDGSVVVERG